MTLALITLALALVLIFCSRQISQRITKLNKLIIQSQLDLERSQRALLDGRCTVCGMRQDGLLHFLKRWGA